MGTRTKVLLGLALLAVLALVARSELLAGDKAKVGGKAPAFESVDENGKPWKSTDHVGKKILVLYFYPADFTGGCTSQACGYRDNLEGLGKNVEIVGVSGDTAMNHMLFKKHYKLPFTLLADTEGKVAKAFGVPYTVGKSAKPVVAKDESGNNVNIFREATIQRYTVVIDQKGNIAAIDKVGKAGDDSKRVTDLVKKLQSK